VYEGTKIEITVDSTNQIYYSFFDAGNCEDYTVWYVPNGFVEYDIISPKDGETIIVTGETEIYPVIKKLVRVELQYDEDGIVLLGAFDISEGDDLTFNQQLLRLYNCQDFSKYLEIEVSEGYKFVRLDIVETDTGNIADLTDVDCDITITAVFTK